MWNWLKLFKKYNFFIVFLILSIFSLWLYIYNSEIHKGYFFQISSFITNPINSFSKDLSHYMHLKKENEALFYENINLYNKNNQYVNIRCISDNQVDYLISDTSKQLYQFLPARLISMTLHESKNYAVIDKGKRDGIKENSGVFTPKGILGVITWVSERYSLVKTYMHPDVKISAAIKNNYVGIAQWDMHTPNNGEIINVPFTVKININDTIYTSHYSTLFPPGIPIGIITAKTSDNIYQTKRYKSRYLEDLISVY